MGTWTQSHNPLIFRLNLKRNHLFKNIHQRFRLNRFFNKLNRLHFFNQIITRFNSRNIFRFWFPLKSKNRLIISKKRKFRQLQQKRIFINHFFCTKPSCIQNQNKKFFISKGTSKTFFFSIPRVITRKHHHRIIFFIIQKFLQSLIFRKIQTNNNFRINQRNMSQISSASSLPFSLFWMHQKNKFNSRINFPRIFTQTTICTFITFITSIAHSQIIHKKSKK